MLNVLQPLVAGDWITSCSAAVLQQREPDRARTSSAASHTSKATRYTRVRQRALGCSATSSDRVQRRYLDRSAQSVMRWYHPKPGTRSHTDRVDQRRLDLAEAEEEKFRPDFSPSLNRSGASCHNLRYACTTDNEPHAIAVSGRAELVSLVMSQNFFAALRRCAELQLIVSPHYLHTKARLLSSGDHHVARILRSVKLHCPCLLCLVAVQQ